MPDIDVFRNELDSLNEVRRLVRREGWCFQHVQAIIVSIDQYGEAATGMGIIPRNEQGPDFVTLTDQMPGALADSGTSSTAGGCTVVDEDRDPVHTLEFSDQTLASMQVALERACRFLPGKLDEAEARQVVFGRIITCARERTKTLAGMTEAGRQAVADLLTEESSGAPPTHSPASE